MPKDGHLPEGGPLPAFIEWSPGPHPSIGQQDLGIRLKRIEIATHAPARLQGIFETLNIAHLAGISEGPTALSFVLDSPKGEVTLD